MFEIAINRIATPELEDVVVYGESDSANIDLDPEAWYASIGDMPIGFPVRLVFEELGVEFKSKLYEGYELWFVPHRVSLLRRKGQAEVTSFGMEVEYLNGKKTCSVVSLIPAPEFTVYGNVGFGFQGEIDAQGIAKVLAGQAGSTLDLPLDKSTLQFGKGTGGSVKFNYSATVSTPRISAVGLGASHCAWEFKKDKDPLFGKTMETWSILALPRFQKELNYRLRFHVTLRTLLIPTWRESDWKEIKCVLNRGALTEYAS